MKTMRFLLVWMGRIPVRFTFTFTMAMLVYLLALSQLVGESEVTTVTDVLLGAVRVPAPIRRSALVRVGVDGVVIVLRSGSGHCSHTTCPPLYTAR